MIIHTTEELKEEMQPLAEHLKGNIATKAEDFDPSILHLAYDEDGLALVQGDLKMRGDFTDMVSRVRPTALSKELIVRAAHIKDMSGFPLAVDATAGMGEDALLLALAGFRVILYEQDPVIAALLRDALRRGEDCPPIAAAIGRMQLREEDSIKALPELEERPALVYLDPMFPKRSKSGLIKKKFQLLQQLESPCASEDELLDAATASGAGRILIKRPAKGPYLAGRKPNLSFEGSVVRYDCILPQG